MTLKKRFNPVFLALAGVAGFVLSAASTQAQSASATISDVAVAGGFDYTITLNNTGSTSLDSFWYGWTDVGNNLPSDPTSIGNNLGWNNGGAGNSIQWTGGTALAAGHSGIFTFFAPSTPTAITTPPSGESVVYVGGIDFSQGVSGDSSGAFSPVLVASPEPSTTALLGIGSLGLLALGWRKVRVQH
jgi:PEP-CTERM motif